MSTRPRVDWAGRLPTKRGVMTALQFRYSTRFHMFLIVAASIAVAVLVTRMLFAFGVDTLWHRYVPALLAAYAAFFVGVWVWLHLSEYGRHLRAARPDRRDFSDAGDVLNLPLPRAGNGPGADFPPGGGGSFDGGGASASWVDPEPLSVGSPLDSLGGPAPDIGIDFGGDEGGCLLVIAIGLMVLALTALFGAAGFVIWQAPAILAEVVFEVLLASTLIRGVRGAAGRDWGRALLRRTWKPFILVAGATIAFAGYAKQVAPEARTAMEVIRTLQGQH